MASGMSKAHAKQGTANKTRRAAYRASKMREQNQLRRVLKHVKQQGFESKSDIAVIARLHAVLDNGTVKRIHAEKGVRY